MVKIQARHPREKVRIDSWLVENGYFDSREKAQAAILAGKIRISQDHVIHKAHQKVAVDASIIIESTTNFVSRGALKLLPALDRYLPSLKGVTCLDLGASTGGFTELLLQRGADRVYAVDVGYGQLHYRLRYDPRIINLEKVNARYLTREQIPEKIDIVTVDLSFISVLKVLTDINKFLNSDAWIFVLIKPQFEANQNEIGKGGIVNSDLVRKRVLAEIQRVAQEQYNWSPMEVFPTLKESNNKNIEFLASFRRK